MPPTGEHSVPGGAGPAERAVVVDLAAIRHNVATLRSWVQPAALMAVVIAAVIMGCFIPLWGMLADRVGKGKIFGTAALLLGMTAYPVFWVFHNYADSYLLTLIALIIPFGIIYAAAYASMASLFSEAFDASVRYSSISFVYQFSGIFASGLTPMIATMLVQANDAQPWYLCGYLCVAGIISAAATWWLARLRKSGEEPRSVVEQDNTAAATASN